MSVPFVAALAQFPQQAPAPAPQIDPRLRPVFAKYDRGEKEAALAELAGLRASAPGDGALIVTIADELNRRTEYSAAEPYARRALELMPAFAPAHKVLGMSLLLGDRTNEAEATYRVAAARFKGTQDEPDLVFNLGMSCAMQSKRLEASEWFGRAIELRPKNALFHFSAAENDRNLGRLEQAEAGFRLASTLEPRHPDAGWKLAVTLAASGRFEEAEQGFRGALEQGPPASRLGAAAEFGIFLFERGRAAEALPLLQRVVKARPSDRRAWNWLARTLRSLGREEQAAQALERYRVLQAEADRTETEYLLGLIRAQLGEEPPDDSKPPPPPPPAESPADRKQMPDSCEASPGGR